MCECYCLIIIFLFTRFALPYPCNSLTAKYFKGNIHVLFMIPVWEARQGAIKLSFFRVLLKISGRCSPVSAVNILSDIIALALFVVFHLLLGMEKTCLALNIYSSESWVMPALELDCHQVQGQLQKHKKKFRNQLGSIVIVLAGP